MLSIPEILAFYGDGRKPPAAVAVPLDELRALVAECERLRGEKAERAARHIRGVLSFLRDFHQSGRVV